MAVFTAVCTAVCTAYSAASVATDLESPLNTDPIKIKAASDKTQRWLMYYIILLRPLLQSEKLRWNSITASQSALISVLTCTVTVEVKANDRNLSADTVTHGMATIATDLMLYSLQD